MNQELCDPMEKEFAADWQRIMDSSLNVFLVSAEAKLFEVYNSAEKSLATALTEAGVKHEQLHALRSAATRSVSTIVKDGFREMKTVASGLQREMNRSLLPKIQARMKGGYKRALSAPGGKGVFDRMNSAMVDYTSATVDTMFSESTKELLAAIDGLIDRIASLIGQTANALLKKMDTVYSVLWDDQRTNKAVSVDPELVRKCRDKLLPSLGKLAAIQTGVLELLGMKREELEFEVVGVDGLDERFAKALKQAQAEGRVFDLCDSDSDDDVAMLDKKPAADPSFAAKVKPEPLFYLSI